MRAAASLLALLEGLIDYAGLFPPAGLGMPDAVRNYARYRAGAHAAALGRFVLPAARLDEFLDALSHVPADARGPSPWGLAVIVRPPFARDFDRVRAFEVAVPRSAPGGVRIEALEGPVATLDQLHALSAGASGFAVFAEVPVLPVPENLITAAHRAGCGVKIRTGGTSPDAFPSSSALAAFLAAWVRHRVPLKATAGLHHPVRSVHPVTHEPGANCATMHGFVNLFMAAALLHAGVVSATGIAAILDEGRPEAFAFEEARAGWSNRWVDTASLVAARRQATGFGSCSFEEPLDDLAALRLLGTTTS